MFEHSDNNPNLHNNNYIFNYYCYPKLEKREF